MPASKGQVFNLAQMAGLHTLRVIAYDEAQNFRDVEFRFEVWIAANGWCLSVNVVSKTKGEAMTCVVEFPAFYKVGLIELASARIAVKGHVDLDEQNPVVEETANLPATLLTGVGDNDKDGVADRKLRFDKDAFVAALYGETGMIPSVIHGGLLPGGDPVRGAPPAKHNGALGWISRLPKSRICGLQLHSTPGRRPASGPPDASMNPVSRVTLPPHRLVRPATSPDVSRTGEDSRRLEGV